MKCAFIQSRRAFRWAVSVVNDDDVDPLDDLDDNHGDGNDEGEDDDVDDDIILVFIRLQNLELRFVELSVKPT